MSASRTTNIQNIFMTLIPEPEGYRSEPPLKTFMTKTIKREEWDSLVQDAFLKGLFSFKYPDTSLHYFLGPQAYIEREEKEGQTKFEEEFKRFLTRVANHDNPLFRDFLTEIIFKLASCGKTLYVNEGNPDEHPNFLAVKGICALPLPEDHPAKPGYILSISFQSSRGYFVLEDVDKSWHLKKIGVELSILHEMKHIYDFLTETDAIFAREQNRKDLSGFRYSNDLEYRAITGEYKDAKDTLCRSHFSEHVFSSILNEGKRTSHTEYCVPKDEPDKQILFLVAVALGAEGTVQQFLDESILLETLREKAKLTITENTSKIVRKSTLDLSRRLMSLSKALAKDTSLHIYVSKWISKEDLCFSLLMAEIFRTYFHNTLPFDCSALNIQRLFQINVHNAITKNKSEHPLDQEHRKQEREKSDFSYELTKAHLSIFSPKKHQLLVELEKEETRRSTDMYQRTLAIKDKVEKFKRTRI